MAWIKRNLFFVIFSSVAVILIGLGIYYAITQWSAERSASEKIAQQYAELTRLNGLNPNPGNDQIDNIKNARGQQTVLRSDLKKISPFFERIPSIPDNSGSTNKISNSEFAAQLRNTVSDLRHSATQQSVLLPQDYYFSFESQRKVMIFDPAGLDKLAVQLGEVKAICEVLFQAKINSLDGIRRESVSTNDNNPSDYISEKTTAGALSDYAPYEVTFRSFSGELAYVLAHFATSSHGFIVKTVNVEPAGNNSGMDESAPGSFPNGQPRADGFPFPRAPNIQAAPQPSAPTSRGPQVILTEKPFRVTMMIEVVKLKPVVTK